MTQTTSAAAAPSSVASAILKRRNERQRFDSADFAMAQQKLKQQMQRLASCEEFASRDAPPAPTSLASSDDFSDWVQCEFEPEPDALDAPAVAATASGGITIPPQQVQRIRLQRFDSADWAMRNHASTTEPTTTTQSLAGTVAKLRLERHGFATCSFVRTPIDLSAQHFVKNA